MKQKAIKEGYFETEQLSPQEQLEEANENFEASRIVRGDKEY